MIRYSDDRLCEVVVCQPDNDTAFYRIVARRADLGASPTEAIQEARRNGASASIAAFWEKASERPHCAPPMPRSSAMRSTDLSPEPVSFWHAQATSGCPLFLSSLIINLTEINHVLIKTSG